MPSDYGKMVGLMTKSDWEKLETDVGRNRKSLACHWNRSILPIVKTFKSGEWHVLRILVRDQCCFHFRVSDIAISGDDCWRIDLLKDILKDDSIVNYSDVTRNHLRAYANKYPVTTSYVISRFLASLVYNAKKGSEDSFKVKVQKALENLLDPATTSHKKTAMTRKSRLRQGILDHFYEFFFKDFQGKTVEK